ncbi:hypothetical protein V144x_02630 [Gimesia aquarii]|uniref:Uncharacterized protein n=1 Tax=Gimesia aquarii TaxID=2527964 RepID=A0A517VP90_9PLAN|nr:hypothetical protein V144x_02630 [Gimesia aquarii]
MTKKTFNWKCLLGNIEGLVSLLCLFIVLTDKYELYLPIALRDKIGIAYWLATILFSLSFGFGIGALRFGNIFGKFCGAFSVIVLSLILFLTFFVGLPPAD